MTGKNVHKRFTLIFAVLLVFLVTNTAIAYHHHDFNISSHAECPICAISLGTSFADFDISASNVQPANTDVFKLIPRKYQALFNPVFLKNRNSRAPPFKLLQYT
jgi:hypothetical protein